MNSIFYNCKKLKNVDFSSFVFKKTINTNNMLYNCKNLDSSFFIENKDIYYVFGFYMTIIYHIIKKSTSFRIFNNKFSFVLNFPFDNLINGNSS